MAARATETTATCTDDELATRAQAGDSDAFAELYTRHRSAVRTALSDNVHDRERQAELVQEVFTRAWAKLDQLRDTARFRPWVFQIARNVAIDDLRHRTQVHVESIDDHDVATADADDPTLVAEVHELAATVRDGFVLLSPRDAAALSMTVNLGFGPTEIAAALDISPGNAKVVLHRARKRLRSALAESADVATARRGR